MENHSKIKVALVRGDSLNEWEGRQWEDLGNEFDITGFCSQKNLYPISGLSFPVTHLATSTDNRLHSLWDRFVHGKFQAMRGLEKKIQNFQIAHTSEISYFYTTQAVRAKKNNPALKVVATVWDNSFGRFEYNYWPGFGQPPAFWRKKIEFMIRENVRGVDLFLPITKLSAELLYEQGVPKEKVVVLTPGVVRDEVNTFSAADIVSSIGLKDSEDELYLMVNRLVKEKGVYDILYGWKLYLASFSIMPQKCLLIIGSGKETNNLKRLVDEWGLQKQVRFIARMPNQAVRSLYSKAKCLLLGSLPGPLWQEQFGYVLAEAISAECPVITTYSGAIPEVVGGAGALCSPGNPVAVREALRSFDNAEIYAKIKQICRVEKQKFAVMDFRSKLVSLYHSIV